MNPKEFHSFLKQLSKNEYPNEVSFIAKVVGQFFELLGYEESQIYFEPALGTFGDNRRYRADAIVASGRMGQPWILLEAKLPRHRFNRKKLLTSGLEQLHLYCSIAHPKYALLFSPELLIIVYDDKEDHYELDQLTIETATKILTLLKNPGNLPIEQIEYPEKTFFQDIIEFETFKLEKAKYVDLLEATISAKTNEEKGKTLEELTAFLFNSIPFLKVKYRNLHTASSEIDLVVQYEGWHKPTIFEEFGRYFLVECKNWQSSIGAKQVRDFKGKLEKTKTRLGFLFARNGVTGVHAGADALLEIHSAFDAKDMFIVVISEEDLQLINTGINFYDILDEKIDYLRFSLYT
jgi:hypothetical protein